MWTIFEINANRHIYMEKQNCYDMPPCILVPSLARNANTEAATGDQLSNMGVTAAGELAV